MVDNTKKNAQTAEKLKKAQEATANRIYKEMLNDNKLLSNLIKKKDYAGICEVSQRIYKNSEALKK